MKRTLTSPLLAVAVLLVLAARAPAWERDLVASMTTTGGLCPYGGCYSELTIYNDGAASYSVGPHKTEFKVDDEHFQSLVSLIKTADFGDLRKEKFTGVCPAAYDGSKVVYAFFTSHGKETLDSCEVVLSRPSPVLNAMQLIEAQALRLTPDPVPIPAQ